MQQDYRVRDSILWVQAPGAEFNAIDGYDRDGFGCEVVVCDVVQPRFVLRGERPLYWVQSAFSHEDSRCCRGRSVCEYQQNSAEQFLWTTHADRYGGGERIVPAQGTGQELEPQRTRRFT